MANRSERAGRKAMGLKPLEIFKIEAMIARLPKQGIFIFFFLLSIPGSAGVFK